MLIVLRNGPGSAKSTKGKERAPKVWMAASTIIPELHMAKNKEKNRLEKKRQRAKKKASGIGANAVGRPSSRTSPSATAISDTRSLSVDASSPDYKLFQRGWEEVHDGEWPKWSPFVLTACPDDPRSNPLGFDYSFANSRYQVVVSFEYPDGWPPMAHLSIKAHDKRCARDWRDMQRIKNELCGPEAEGVELYPAESRLMDEANQFHIFVIHPDAGTFPFGQKYRTHMTPVDVEKQYKELEEVLGVAPEKAGFGQPKQREFEAHHGADGCGENGMFPWPQWVPQGK